MMKDERNVWKENEDMCMRDNGNIRIGIIFLSCHDNFQRTRGEMNGEEAGIHLNQTSS